MTHAINIADFEALARESMSQMAYDYYAGGALDEVTLRRNESAFDDIRLRYRVLRDVATRDLTTTVLGAEIAMPILVAPTAFHQLAHAEGEVATARAAGRSGTVMILSTLSNCPIEDVVAATTGPTWFQLYVYKDRGVTRDLIARAEQAGCRALVLTVDAPFLGSRERDIRNRFELPAHLAASNLTGNPELLPVEHNASQLASYVGQMFDASLTWEVVDWLAGVTKVPILVKGVVHPEDARLAVEHGASAVIVSNHGGRQLDTAPATIEVLPEIVAAVDGAIEVLLDGGIRRGSDVIKALALGAKAVAVGRPVLWGLAADGQTGVEKVLSILRAETDVALGLCGFSRLEDLSSDVVMVG
ncbi:MAG: alpha-hydroxy acid oxidase [Acidobacteriota bacterium]